MAEAIGIGGIFFRYKDEAAMKQWFETALGLSPNDYGILFAFNVASAPKGFLQLARSRKIPITLGTVPSRP